VANVESASLLLLAALYNRLVMIRELPTEALEILGVFPESLIRTVQLMKTYRAKVTITAEDIPEQDQLAAERPIDPMPARQAVLTA
jgi:hypothetical protein